MSEKPQPLAEVLEHLDKITRAHPASRLEADMARDAVAEVGKQLAFYSAKARRDKRRRRRLREDAGRLLDALALSPSPRWPVADPPEALEPLAESYRRLKHEGYPAFAAKLHGVAGRADPRDFSLILSDTILRRGERILVEGLTLHPGAGRAALLERVRPLLGAQLVKVLARQASYRLTPDVGRAADALIRQSLVLLDGLLNTAPAVRLYWPAIGTPYDAAKHERTGNKAEPVGERLVRCPLFPGLCFADGPRLVERAVVATRRTEEAG